MRNNLSPLQEKGMMELGDALKGIRKAMGEISKLSNDQKTFKEIREDGYFSDIMDKVIEVENWYIALMNDMIPISKDS